MTLEELKALLGDEEHSEEIKEFLHTLGFRTPDEVMAERKGVDSKNKELLREKKDIQEKIAKAESRVEELGKIVNVLHDNDIGVDDLENLNYDKIEESLIELKSKAISGQSVPADVDQLQRDLKKSQRELEKAKLEVKAKIEFITQQKAEIDERDLYISNTLIDEAIRSELLKHNYSPLVITSILPALRAESGAQVQYDEETGQRSAIVDDGGSISSWIELWKDSEAGKALCMAPVNTGGGARGGAGGKTKLKPWKEYTPQEKAELYQRDPEAYRRLRDAALKK